MVCYFINILFYMCSNLGLGFFGKSLASYRILYIYINDKLKNIFS